MTKLSKPNTAVQNAHTLGQVNPNSPKPPYQVPLMSQIADVPWNGRNVISTFSGCGGSSLGYKMAGFRVLWANEFIPAAQDTYRANFPDTIMDTRDIREVCADEILDRIGLSVGALDILDGSPPCSSFSTAGKLADGWGKVKQYSDTKQRTDDLFFEYIRLLTGLQPKVFVAENVSGLVKGLAKGYFFEILEAMKASGYQVTARVLDSRWLGVPQMRQRVIFIGVRNDLHVSPVHPKPLPYFYTVRDALPWVTGVKHAGRKRNWKDANRPSPTIVQSDSRTSPTACFSGGGFIHTSCYDTAIEAETDFSEYAIGSRRDQLNQGQRDDKFFSLVRSDLDVPSPTITQRSGVTSLAGVTHPTEKRKFSIAELKRICAFPDDFKLTGTFTQQWERLGRAVPPVMMSHVAACIRDQVLSKIS